MRLMTGGALLALLAIAGGLMLDIGNGVAPANPPQVNIPSASSQAITPIPDFVAVDERKAALGRLLFHEKRLSKDNTLSCASCHDLDKAGMDGLSTAVGINGQRGTVNSPTVLNSGFNFSQFWDGRADTLESQVAGPVHNDIEMGSSWSEVIAKLGRDPEYRRSFKAIWEDGITPANIQSAIAEFERTLVTPNSPFDRYLKGDRTALSPEARQGWDLFRNLGCIACHQGVNMGGNLYANLGVMGDYFADRGQPVEKADLGRFNVTGREEDRHVFKVPTMRNVALTGPYLHDGTLQRLEDAVDVMARYQLGIELPEQDRRALVAFLSSLNGVLPVNKP